ncbi:MAG: septal ring lytic transglycosylase RlpA family protein [Symploca sp. SIO2G7]|nr:septal ring lytic transglycosylase RlpA family protein [Symploca sp. SIO2G7]
MFDVPVQAVTVFSSPLFVNISSQVFEIALPQMPAALLPGEATWPQSASTKVAVTVLPTVAQAKVSIPQSSFQLMEPLNLADAASLEKSFIRSLQPAANDPRDVLPQISLPTMAVSTAKASREDKKLVQVAAASAVNLKPSPVEKVVPAMGKELSQCVNVAQPDFGGQIVTVFQVLLRGTVVGNVSSGRGVEHVVQFLQALLGDTPLNASEIMPILGSGQPVIHLSNDVLLNVVNQSMTNDVAAPLSDMSHEWAVIVWSDRLRQAMGASPLDAGNMHTLLKGLHPSENRLNGLASWYGPYFHGRLTANGEIFDQNTLTAAHKTLPFNTLLQVRNVKNDRTVVVRINDRGPYTGKRSLDLSKAAAQCLGSERTGVIPYEAVIMEPSP